MNSFDYLAEDRVVTPAGPVDVSVVYHEDGSVSVVAWLASAERRVGYVHFPPRQSEPDAVDLDPALAIPRVRAMMHDVLIRARRACPAGAPIVQQLVEAGLCTDDELAGCWWDGPRWGRRAASSS